MFLSVHTPLYPTSLFRFVAFPIYQLHFYIILLFVCGATSAATKMFLLFSLSVPKVLG